MKTGIARHKSKMVFFMLVVFGLALNMPAASERIVSSEPAPIPSFSDLAQFAAPAVVNISINTKIDGLHTLRDKQFERFFDGIPDEGLKRTSLGSGFIIDPAGLIVTNYHVVEKADTVTIRMSDEKQFSAKTIGRDPESDLALIRITNSVSDLPILRLGDSDALDVGDWVLAIGNPFGLSRTVTHGIISAAHRVIGLGLYDNFLQTDASMNPGNSGGPLINLKGEVVGVTTAIAHGRSLGFAIPSNTTRTVINQLLTKGRVIRGYIGVSVQEVTSKIANKSALGEVRGAFVSDVVEAGPAATAGMKSGDIIVAYGDKAIRARSDLPILVADTPIGQIATVTVFRKGRILTLEVRVSESKEERIFEEPQTKPRAEDGPGLAAENITPELQKKYDVGDKTGVIVVDVIDDTPAAKAGIAPGDIIKEIDRRPIDEVGQLSAALEKAGSSASLLFLIKRDDSTFYVIVKAPE